MDEIAKWTPNSFGSYVGTHSYFFRESAFPSFCLPLQKKTILTANNHILGLDTHPILRGSRYLLRMASGGKKGSKYLLRHLDTLGLRVLSPLCCRDLEAF